MSKKEFLVAIDSDGCAMDTMNVKHERFFGPLAAKQFNIKNKEEFLKEWNRVNLFSMTRGINRFKALEKMLEYSIKIGEEIEDLEVFKNWTKDAKSLSMDSLKTVIDKTDDPVCKKAYAWSESVNKGIAEELSDEDKPFDGVYENLKKISQYADIAIVSSAAYETLKSEWNRHKLMDFVDYVYGQEQGKKDFALKDLHEKGYEKSKMLMVGDAPGDEKAAMKNGVSFFPILFSKEKESWEKLSHEALDKFLAGEYEGEYNKEMSECFAKHLEKGSK